MIKMLAPSADLFIAAKAANHRALPPTQIASVASKYIDHVHKSKNSIEGLNYAQRYAKKNDLILCIGSHYLVSDILVFFNEQPC